MRKTARLDQILFDLGYATQEQITLALIRQRSKGGRLGMNLVESGFITSDQLLTALGEQFQLPTTVPSDGDIPAELLSRIPPELVLDHLVLPLAWNDRQKVLTLAVANPVMEEVLSRLKKIFGARALRIRLAPDNRILEIAQKLIRPKAEGEAEPAGIELPELFGLGEAEKPPAAQQEAREPRERRVLMITSGVAVRNFLPPLVRREGVALTVVGTAEEAAEAMGGKRFQEILLAQDMVDTFEDWVREGQVPEPDAEVVVYPSLSGALLENPLPYESTVRSLKVAVQALADLRSAEFGISPPYGLVASDLEAMAGRLKMRRISADGLHLAAHLLLPAREGMLEDPVGSSEPFTAFASSLELATRLRFPWRLDLLLDTSHAVFSGREAEPRRGKASKELRQAAQLLALVWYRHNHVALPRGTDEEAMLALRAALREKAGTLASLDLVEAYLRLLADRGGVLVGGADRQILLVGGERIARALGQGLRRVGCQVVETQDLGDAQTMAERRAPGAIVLDYDEFPREVDRFARVAMLDGSALLFVLADTTDPSLVLNLLDIGVDDVFVPPHDYDVMAARINRAVASRARQRPARQGEPGQFSATFQVFSFLDLIQTLAQSRKSVRIDLARQDRENATIFLQKGQMVHATCGDRTGIGAVEQVVGWEDDGEFTVSLESRFPEPNIHGSNESILMEACRLLDERRS